LAAAEAGVPVIECAPSAVKASTAGFGNADKRAVTTTVKKLLGVSAIPGPDDAADALAIALAAETVFKSPHPKRSTP
ncbi:MAG: crossover junction endodeoxyribonuclease RuvC, partial [Candidatus Liptonbacteria bacterium]|nr:crossover junction endodeoxyribonuclease RuvC [Candidatus Liptonbacteria bacterium]